MGRVMRRLVPAGVGVIGHRGKGRRRGGIRRGQDRRRVVHLGLGAVLRLEEGVDVGGTIAVISIGFVHIIHMERSMR